MNSGTAKEAYALLFSMNFTGLCVLAFSDQAIRRKLALLGGCVAAGVVFALISAPVWYTFYRSLKGAYTSYNDAAGVPDPARDAAGPLSTRRSTARSSRTR